MRASRILICSTAHQPPLRLSPNLVRSRTSSPKPVNRSAHLRTTPAGNWQTAVPVRLPLPLPRSSFHDSRERASIIVDERERARERELALANIASLEPGSREISDNFFGRTTNSPQLLVLRFAKFANDLERSLPSYRLSILSKLLISDFAFKKQWNFLRWDDFNAEILFLYLHLHLSVKTFVCSKKNVERTSGCFKTRIYSVPLSSQISASVVDTYLLLSIVNFIARYILFAKRQSLYRSL